MQSEADTIVNGCALTDQCMWRSDMPFGGQLGFLQFLLPREL